MKHTLPNFSYSLSWNQKKYILLFVPIILILMSLGFWQVGRYYQREAVVREVFAHASLKGENFEEIANITNYQKISAQGTIDKDHILWLYRRHPMAKHIDGAFLIARIMTPKGASIVSVLGWVKLADKAKIIEEIGEGKEVYVSGLVIPEENESYFIPKNHYEKGMCFTMNMGEITKKLGAQDANYFLAGLELRGLELGGLDLAGLDGVDKDFKNKILPIKAEMMIKLKNDHLEYAATWFCLAFCAGMMMYILVKRK